MPIDLTSVNWVYLGQLSGIAFVAALIGNLLSFKSWLIGAILATVLFAVGYVFFSNCPQFITSYCPFVLPPVNPQ